MKRIQVQLTEKQARELKKIASGAGSSISAVIRQAVDKFVIKDEREERIRRVMALAGKYRDREGRTDLGRNHDRYAFDE